MKRVPLEVRFWSRVDRSGGEDACWPFLGHLERGGYGHLGVKGRSLKASRVAYALANDLPVDFPRSMFLILHHCDNPPCCNPKHLYAGSQKDNARDRSARGRTAVGTRNGRSRLTPEIVIQIRQLSSSMTQVAMGELLGVTPAAISSVQRGLTWKHLQGARGSGL